MTETQCASCTMPVESGTYCTHCADASGNLIAFQEAFDRMVQWTLRNDSNVSREDAEARTLEFMAQRPAWKAHPELVKRQS